MSQRRLEEGSPEFRSMLYNHEDLDSDGDRVSGETTTRTMAADRYIAEVNRIPPMTLEQERAAGEDILRGRAVLVALAAADLLTPQQHAYVLREATLLVVRGQEALVKGHLRLALALARRVGERGRLGLDDLIGFANLGLARAATTFNPLMGARFATHAFTAIQGEINRGRSEQGRMDLLNRGGQAVLKIIHRVSDAFTQTHQRRPTLADLVQATGLTAEVIQRTLLGAQEPASWDTMYQEKEASPSGGNYKHDVTPDRTTPTPAAVLDRATQHDRLDAMLSTLSKQQETVIRLRYGFDPDGPLTHAEIGQRLVGRSGKPLSRARVQQIERKALAALAQHPEPLQLLTPDDVSGAGQIRQSTQPAPGME